MVLHCVPMAQMLYSLRHMAALNIAVRGLRLWDSALRASDGMMQNTTALARTIIEKKTAATAIRE